MTGEEWREKVTSVPYTFNVHEGSVLISDQFEELKSYTGTIYFAMNRKQD